MRGEGKEDAEESKGSYGFGGKVARNSDEELKRNVKWISFTKPKSLVFGFEHLAPNQLPTTSSASRGLSVCFDKINGWNLPSSIIDEVSKSRGKYELSVQLSFSLFHFGSSSFFGSTWMGAPMYIDDLVSSSLDLDYAEVLYLITRIVDPSCIGVVELVCNRIDTKKGMIVAQYGCGWSMINLFQQPFPGDISEGPENILATSVPIYSGSPRDLVLDADIKTLLSRLKGSAGSKLFFRIFSHRKLVPTGRLLSENELVGRYDVIAGLVGKEITLPGTTKPTSVPCIGDELLQIGKRGVLHCPSKPAVALPFSLQVLDCYVYVPDRPAMESRMRNLVAKNLNTPPGSEIRIISRDLKIGNPNFYICGDALFTVQVVIMIV